MCTQGSLGQPSGHPTISWPVHICWFFNITYYIDKIYRDKYFVSDEKDMKLE